MKMKGRDLRCQDLSSDSRAAGCETLSEYYIREMLIDESRVRVVNEMTLMTQSFPCGNARLGYFSCVLRGPL